MCAPWRAIDSLSMTYTVARLRYDLGKLSTLCSARKLMRIRTIAYMILDRRTLAPRQTRRYPI